MYALDLYLVPIASCYAVAMGVVEVLYNSDYAFSERLYGDLDVEICCVRLHQPLHQIVRLSQPYVWKKLSRQCFQGLMCINRVRRPCCVASIVLHMW